MTNENLDGDETHSAKKYICEVEAPGTWGKVTTRPHIAELSFSNWTDTSMVSCPSKHITHRFLACDVKAKCWSLDTSGYNDEDRKTWGVPSRQSCQATLTSLPPSFMCSAGRQRVPYTLVCDHRPDCVDQSDEGFCKFLPCLSDERTCGRSKQCYPVSERCNHRVYCYNAADEQNCKYAYGIGKCDPPQPPVLFDIFDHGRLQASVQILQVLDKHTGALECPDTHFQCAGGGYCFPVFVLCNGVNDCPGREDETACDSTTTCVGFYRCRASLVCLHPKHMCDGTPQCPQREDELLCRFQCPDVCTCHGLAFVCRHSFHVQDHLALRYLDVSGTGMTPHWLQDHIMLIHISLAKCDLTTLQNISFRNLNSLDVSENYLSSVDTDMIAGLPNLEVLFLSGNPLVSVFTDCAGCLASHLFDKLKKLDLSHVPLHTVNVSVFDAFPSLEVLNLSHSHVHRLLSENSTQPLGRIRLLDMKACPVPVLPRQLTQMTQLQQIVSGNPKLCCPAVLPADFPTGQCLSGPAMDQISSCEDLLGSSGSRAMFVAFLVLTILGNVGSLVLRARNGKNSEAYNNCLNIFLHYLCLPHLLMGGCLCTLLVADHVYSGVYLWHDTAWRQSLLCHFTGFVSSVSRDMASLLMFLMTLDRCLRVQVSAACYRFTGRKVHTTCLVTLALCLVLRSVALWPVTRQGGYGGHGELCLPFPVWRSGMGPRPVFHLASITVFNSILFVMTAAAQGVLYHHCCSHDSLTLLCQQAITPSRKPVLLARPVRYMAVSHLLYTLYVGALGTMAAAGVDLPGNVNTIYVLYVHPLSCAADPYLYTVGLYLEWRRHARDDVLLKRLQIQRRLRKQTKETDRKTAVTSARS